MFFERFCSSSYNLQTLGTNHYSQPPNSTLGGLHMTQTTHDFVEWANATKNSPKWSCSWRQWWIKNFLLEMPSDMVENFPFHLFKPREWFFLVVIPSIVHKVNHLTR
jgi:hypothetical protein